MDMKVFGVKPPAVPTDPPGRKFKPRYRQQSLQSPERPYHLAVIVSAADNSNQFYVQVEDEKERNLYQLMQSDLQQEEFGKASHLSASPAIGNAYAYYASEHRQWFRVLFELGSDGHLQIFYVDTGHRKKYDASMELHRLPEKYFKLPARALKCLLHGVSPPGALGRERTERPLEFSLNLLHKYEKKPALIFVEGWNAGEVGHPIINSPEELSAWVVLYLDEHHRSFNLFLVQKRMAIQWEAVKTLEKQQHHLIRQRIRGASKLDVSQGQASSSRPESLRQDLTGQSSGALSVNPSYDEERGEKNFDIQAHQSAAALPIACRPLLNRQSEESSALDSALSVGVSSASTDIQRQLSESIEAPSCSEESSAEVIEGRKPLEPLNSFQPEPKKVNEIVAVRGTQPSDAVEGAPLEIPGKTSNNLNEELITLGMAREHPVPLIPASRPQGARPRVVALKPNSTTNKNAKPAGSPPLVVPDNAAKEGPLRLRDARPRVVPPKPKKTAKRLGRRPLVIPSSKKYENVTARVAPLTHLTSSRRRTMCLPRDARRDGTVMFALNRLLGLEYDMAKIPRSRASREAIESASKVSAKILKEVLNMFLVREEDDAAEQDPPLDYEDPFKDPIRMIPPNAHTLAGAQGLLKSVPALEQKVAGEENGATAHEQGDPDEDQKLAGVMFSLFALSIALGEESPNIEGSSDSDQPEEDIKKK